MTELKLWKGDGSGIVTWNQIVAAYIAQTSYHRLYSLHANRCRRGPGDRVDAIIYLLPGGSFSSVRPAAVLLTATSRWLIVSIRFGAFCTTSRGRDFCEKPPQQLLCEPAVFDAALRANNGRTRSTEKRFGQNAQFVCVRLAGVPDVGVSREKHSAKQPLTPANSGDDQLSSLWSFFHLNA